MKRIAYAIGILFPVLAFAAVRGFAAPIKAGAAAQMTYAVAHPALHQVEQVIVPLASVLSLIGVIGLVQLAIRRSPRLAMTGGALALAGWGTLPIWAGQDNLTYLMGKIGSNPQLVHLWNQFNTTGTNTYLYIFIIGHLLGPLLLAVALRRARMLPRWSPIVIAATIPLHVLTFATGARVLRPHRLRDARRRADPRRHRRAQVTTAAAPSGPRRPRVQLEHKSRPAAPLTERRASADGTTAGQRPARGPAVAIDRVVRRGTPEHVPPAQPARARRRHDHRAHRAAGPPLEPETQPRRRDQ